MRRLHVDRIHEGELEIPPAEAHHARDVLRLREGDTVELFDDAGRRGRATITSSTPSRFMVRVESVEEAAASPFEWVVASAVPKGSRVDWMIEKLSELGTAKFVPLAAARSVVLPEGKGKRERWGRLAAESAKQSRRPGVMRIDELTPVPEYLRSLDGAPAWFFSTGDAIGVEEAMSRLPEDAKALHLLIGPEGGWTDEELRLFAEAKLTPVTLGRTVLRVETAAVAAAALAAAVVAPRLNPP